MASGKLKDLVPELQAKALSVKSCCKKSGGFELSIYCTLRTPEEQARLYRQSRTRKEINLKIRQFKNAGFDFLADILESVGPCSGPYVTNAGPGESWHNYGQAFDAVPVICGKPVWNCRGAGKKIWNTYGEAVRNAGLCWAGDWKNFPEFPHAQLSAFSNPLRLLTPKQARLALLEHKIIRVKRGTTVSVG